MKNALKNIDQAYGLLSQLVVNGDNVDLLAGARQALRVAYGQLELQMKKTEENDEKRDENDEKREEVKEDVGNPAEDAE